MGRRVNNVPDVDETLSQESPEVQEELLNEIIEPEDNQDNQVEPAEEKAEEMNNLSNEPAEEKPVEPVDTDFNVGDRVKLGDIKNDTLGRRIHNGIKNYVYTIRSIRPDGVACIECLTHVFNVKVSDLIKV